MPSMPHKNPPIILSILLVFLAMSCQESLDFPQTRNQKHVRFFFSKQVLPMNRFQHVRVVFADEIPVPTDMNRQLKTIAYHNKGVYKVTYASGSRIAQYEYFEQGRFLMKVVFEYDATDDSGERLQALKYYAPNSQLIAVERVSYNDFGFPKKTERYVVPGYRKVHLY